MEREKLLKDIEDYCAATGQAPSTFCLRVVKNGTLYKRLQEGGDCGVKALDKIRKYIAENPPKAKEAAE